jgi:succinate dehydrogenase / fumarate reductase cytochrome b subunit
MGLIGSFYRSSVGKKSVMAASGLLLSFFLFTHLVGNSFTFIGREAFIAYAEQLHSWGILITFVEAGLFSIFFIHILTGIILFLENLKARPSRYSVNTSEGGRSWGSRTMPYTGAIVLIFILVHLKNLHFSSKDLVIADLVREILSSPVLAFYYIFSLIALALHLSHGFWSLFQTIGINHEKYNQLLLKGALIFSILLSAVYILIPVLTLVSRNFLL